MDLKEDNGREWIDSVKGFSSGEWASSPHGCQARILQALGEDISYDDLVCYGGFAFRVSVHEEMCPSAGHPSACRPNRIKDREDPDRFIVVFTSILRV